MIKITRIFYIFIYRKINTCYEAQSAHTQVRSIVSKKQTVKPTAHRDVLFKKSDIRRQHHNFRLFNPILCVDILVFPTLLKCRSLLLFLFACTNLISFVGTHSGNEFVNTKKTFKKIHHLKIPTSKTTT